MACIRGRKKVFFGRPRSWSSMVLRDSSCTSLQLQAANISIVQVAIAAVASSRCFVAAACANLRVWGLSARSGYVQDGWGHHQRCHGDHPAFLRDEELAAERPLGAFGLISCASLCCALSQLPESWQALVMWRRF